MKLNPNKIRNHHFESDMKIDQKEHSRSGKFSSTLFETLKWGYKPFFKRVIFCLICGFIGRILLLGNANIIGQWVDTYCVDSIKCEKTSNYFSHFSSLDFIYFLLTITVLGFIFTLFYRVYLSRLSAQAVSRIYDEVTFRTSRYPMFFFDNNLTGKIITRFSSDYGNVFRVFGGPLAEFLAIIFDLVAMILLTFIASPLYLPLLILIGVVEYALYRLNRNRLRGVRRDLAMSRSPSIAHFAETIQGASSIRIFLRESSFEKRFSNLDSQFLFQKLRTIRHISFFSIQMSFATAIFFLVTTIMAYYFVKIGWMSVGSVGVAFTFIIFAGTTIQMFFEWLAQFEEALIGLERLDVFLRKPIEKGSFLPSGSQFKTGHPFHSFENEERLKQKPLISELNASVKVEDLWFKYSDELPYILKGVSFEIKPGERVGVIGRTGSGKTTLIQNLFYLYPIERGRIFINDFYPDVFNDSKGIDLELYRRSVGLISQEPIILRGTLRENLDLGFKKNDLALIEALNRVGLGSWLVSHEKGLDRELEERGKNVSLGEKQLICMARCLLQDVPIVVMDEATSSIDPQTEENIVKATSEFFKGKTQIIVAHRLSTLKFCDRVLWLDRGEIKMFGQTNIVLDKFQKEKMLC